jgi:hypothetical protein
MTVTLWTHIQEVLGSNLDWSTGYPDSGFSSYDAITETSQDICDNVHAYFSLTPEKIKFVSELQVEDTHSYCST